MSVLNDPFCSAGRRRRSRRVRGAEPQAGQPRRRRGAAPRQRRDRPLPRLRPRRQPAARRACRALPQRDRRRRGRRFRCCARTIGATVVAAVRTRRRRVVRSSWACCRSSAGRGAERHASAAARVGAGRRRSPGPVGRARDRPALRRRQHHADARRQGHHQGHATSSAARPATTRSRARRSTSTDAVRRRRHVAGRQPHAVCRRARLGARPQRRRGLARRRQVHVRHPAGRHRPSVARSSRRCCACPSTTASRARAASSTRPISFSPRRRPTSSSSAMRTRRTAGRSTQLDVGFRVGPVQKMLRVFGDRDVGRARTFVARAVRQDAARLRARVRRCRSRSRRHPERDWDWRNPVGTGFAVARDNADGRGAAEHRVPERADQRRGSDRPRPAGFGADRRPLAAAGGVRGHLRRRMDEGAPAAAARRFRRPLLSVRAAGPAGAGVPARRRAGRPASTSRPAAICASSCRRCSSASRRASTTAAARSTRIASCTPSFSSPTFRACRWCGTRRCRATSRCRSSNARSSRSRRELSGGELDRRRPTSSSRRDAVAEPFTSSALGASTPVGPRRLVHAPRPCARASAASPSIRS